MKDTTLRMEHTTLQMKDTTLQMKDATLRREDTTLRREDTTLHFIFKGEDKKYENAFLNEVYRVNGWIFHQETHSYLTLEYEFLTLKEANDYFDKIKESHPLSTLKIYKHTWQQQRYYG